MTEEQQHRKDNHRNWRLNSSQYLGEISALSFLHLPSHLSPLPFLLAGSGSQILLYDLSSSKLIRSFQVFEGVRVHGITCSGASASLSNKLVLFGEKRVKLFDLRIDYISSSGDVLVELDLVYSLPRFSHWVLDVCFLKGCFSPLVGETALLAIGCSDNSILVWDIRQCKVILEVQSPERCLLYSMRLWGDDLQALCVASGTIYNEIIVWKVVFPKLDGQQHRAVHLCRLIGHEGSIFRLVWSSDGSKLVSVSDDRSARIWEVGSVQKDSENLPEVVGPVLFGHSARVWDCCISDSLIVTAGEDCTCRVWDLEGKQLEMIKEHIGRGIWRCLYDPKFSLLVTAGFDSAIKVHQLHNSVPRSFLDCVEKKESTDKTELFTACLPNLPQHVGLMDSKSEYVRCLRFTGEDTIYVATNHGCLYHVKLSTNGNVKWTKLVRISEEGPIICMDLLPERVANASRGLNDWVALGDGKGSLTLVHVIGDIFTPEVGLTRTWTAGPERQLLGTCFCRSLGHRYVFTTNPRGSVKLWRLSHPLASVSCDPARACDVSLVAEFSSCFGMRIMCLDASFKDEVLVCGDLRGNLVLFPLSKDVLESTCTSELKISALNHFKGAHGISTVSSLSVTRLSSNKVEIRSTGGDGCICYLEFDKHDKTLEFMGLKQVKELSLIQSVCTDICSTDNWSNHEYAAGFTSTDFILWNLTTETKVVQISCGGWRRPHSFYLGDVPEMRNCFAYLRDEVIHIYRNWTEKRTRQIFPQNLHMQFHGREIHSLCFVPGDSKVASNTEQRLPDTSSWIATGCEDGTVRLTRYASEVKNWSTSESLGEHVGGSAVRSVCFVSKTHVIASDTADMLDGSAEDKDSESPCLLISVGAKRVLTSWLLRNGRIDGKEETLENEHKPSSGVSTSMTFQWLSTDMPAKHSRPCGRTENFVGVVDGVSIDVAKTDPKICLGDKYEDDWRYMAVTAFLVKCAGSRSTICFVVVACSDATLTLRALVLPHRLWFDVASLVSLSSPVLALQHVIITLDPSAVENIRSSGIYLVISGATDGSIAFWDVTKSVEAFVKEVSALNVEKVIDCQKRPRTGRGSQGGRKWKLLSTDVSKKRQGNDGENGTVDLSEAENGVSHESSVSTNSSSSETCEIQPIHIVRKAHQSGVNCLHISRSKSSQCSAYGSRFNVISGGDDQALHYLRVDIVSTSTESQISEPPVRVDEYQIQNYGIRLLAHGGVASAHSSAVKGVWTDGNWVFSTGLDQRVRCWHLEESGKLVEHAHIIISVPEPEALDARPCGNNQYQIAIAGRGMQMVEFSASSNRP